MYKYLKMQLKQLLNCKMDTETMWAGGYIPLRVGLPRGLAGSSPAKFFVPPKPRFRAEIKAARRRPCPESKLNTSDVFEYFRTRALHLLPCEQTT
jgi:hypothetical protein